MFGQVLTAMVTPMTRQGEVDYGRAWRLARYLVDHGSDGLVVAATTGEGPTLTSEEKVALFRTMVEAVGERAVVIASTGTYDTRESVELTERAAEVGCHGVMAVTPYYSRPPQSGLLAHFRAIADASELPVIVYNIPSRTGRLIEVETLARLSEHPRIVATKDAVGDLEFTTRTRLSIGEGFAIYSGDDVLTLPMLAVGGTGVISVGSHLAGRQMKAMVEAATKGDLEEARRIHLGLAPLLAALFLETNPIPVKAALGALWEPVGEPRLPLVAAREETVRAVERALGHAQQLEP
ncbi:MAG: 4-hydroxy-tetrahydrodipicolinate synthase [Actinomycetota bacterium]|nr:4-hydroxy-tetrahydrodipicolinate synthase [Actinomycetota bacterium]